MKLIFIFLIIFVAGPIGFAFLSRAQPGRATITTLFVGAVALIAAAFIFALGVSALYPTSPYPGLGAVLALWVAWVVILALCFHAIKMRATSDGSLKLAFVAGAMATTLPWFGLYIARIMSS